MPEKRILILGVTGMLGHKLFHRLSEQPGYLVYGTARRKKPLLKWFDKSLTDKITGDVDAANFDAIIRVLAEVRPDVVVNCIGIIKQLPAGRDPLTAIAVNSLFSHRLARACEACGTRLIHISTDCVFQGAKGGYTEKDSADATDLYGRTKYLGEVNYPHCVTLRTSIIGHELKGNHGLVEWFLAQDNSVRGYRNAVFSGLPTIELSRVISTYVIPDWSLTRLYHISADPISKYDLLNLTAARYGKMTVVEPDDSITCDRSLDSSYFRRMTGYCPPGWPELVDMMYQDYLSLPCYRIKRQAGGH